MDTKPKPSVHQAVSGWLATEEKNSAVLTDAELVPDEKTRFTAMCDNCSRCVEACPVGALDDLASFNKKGCSSHYKIENKKFTIKCFLCRTICPHSFGIKSFL